MSKVSFPHMGNYSTAFRRFLEGLGNEVILPPRPSKKTLSLGVKYAPEFACLPLKILLGTYIEVLEKGAEVIVTTGGSGPCRAGHYAQIQKEILEDLGYKCEMIVLEGPRQNIFDFLRKLKRLNAAGHSWLGVWRHLKAGWAKVKALDDVERLLHKVRPRELEKGSANKVFKQALAWIDRTQTEEETAQARDRGLEALRNVPQDSAARPLKIGIVGEIYVLLEPASNLDLEKTLGEMGVEVHRSIFLTGWTRENAIEENGGHDVKGAAAPYLPEMIGGHGQDSVGHTIMYARDGFDGVIQLAPFTCIPEIVARSILPKLSEENDIPVLSFFLDEQTGEAGFKTRLEAFVDLLARRRARKEGVAGLGFRETRPTVAPQG